MAAIGPVLLVSGADLHEIKNHRATSNRYETGMPCLSWYTCTMHGVVIDLSPRLYYQGVYIGCCAHALALTNRMLGWHHHAMGVIVK